jgi:DNA-binding transcriptional LysR family regulator
VRALEDELGVALFERHPNGVRLTTAGERFLGGARRALSDLEHAVMNAAAAGRGVEGSIRIGVFPAKFDGFVGDLLEDFCTSHPLVTLDFIEDAPREHIARVLDRRIDITFIGSPSSTPGVDAEIMWAERALVAISADHPLAGCEGVDWNVLKDETFVFGRGAADIGLYQLGAERLGRFGRKSSISYQDVSQDSVMQLVKHGLGLSLVSDASGKSRYPGVVFRPLIGEEVQILYSAVWLPGNDNPALRRFLSLARARAAGRSPPPPPASCE